jgi:4'-phosphopantetheinyl transferase
MLPDQFQIHQWLKPETFPASCAGEVHLWKVSLDEPVEWNQLREILSSPERQRAARFYFKKDEQEYSLTRAALRKIIGDYINLPPDRIEFSYETNGKPALAKHLSYFNLKFNVSHTKGMALIAIGFRQRVGVDIEFIRPDLVTAQTARLFFSAEEFEIFQKLPEAARVKSFFLCWTRKEALVKATGDGLAYPLNQLHIPTLNPNELSRTIKVKEKRDTNWEIHDLLIDENYAAALAIEKKGSAIKKWSYDFAEN